MGSYPDTQERHVSQAWETITKLKHRLGLQAIGTGVGLLALFLLPVVFAPSVEAAENTDTQYNLQEHCPDHNGHPGKVDVEGTSEYGDTITFAEGTEFCVKAANHASGKIVSDGEPWTVTWKNRGGNTPDISYYVIYSEPETEPELKEISVVNKPTTVAPTCDYSGKLLLHAQEGIQWKVDGEYVDAGEYHETGYRTVVAVAKDGYKLTGQTEWTLKVKAQLTGEECEDEVKEISIVHAPRVFGPTCAKDGKLALFEQEGVKWMVNGEHRDARIYYEPGMHTVTAVAKDGYTLVGKTEWNLEVKHKLPKEKCETEPTKVYVAAPTTTAATCDSTGTLYLPETEGVKWKLNGEYHAAGTYYHPGAYKIEAVAKDGYYLKGDTTWNMHIEAKLTGEECRDHEDHPKEIVIAIGPSTVAATCDAHGKLVLPEIEGVKWMVNGEYREAGHYYEPGTHTVVAVAMDGYVLTGDTEWTLVVEARHPEEVCKPAVVPAPEEPERDTQETVVHVEGDDEGQVLGMGGGTPLPSQLAVTGPAGAASGLAMSLLGSMSIGALLQGLYSNRRKIRRKFRRQ